MFVTSQRSLAMDYVKLFSITGMGCLSSFPSEILWEGRREDGVVLEAAATIPAYWAVVILKQVESMSKKGISHSCQTEDRGVPYGWVSTCIVDMFRVIAWCISNKREF